ncbi:MAG: chemotaxis protein CheR [Rhodospirillales bacterium 70-18]|nr:methyltransferase domain-containing protein [Rhodospirillales bacterium]OJY76232.1 MAG: chemotaxis protein CheR [Rhodospirillales bacterium 70-18]
MTPHSFAALAALLRAGSGLVIGPDKEYLLETRLAAILKQHGLRDLDALAERLRATLPGRAALEFQVIEAMTTNESFFFRDDKPFAHFRAHALPALHAARPPGARLRVWSAAASSGQEAYSLAMILAECRALLGSRTVEILGTDISREQLARAQEALYTQFEVQRGLPMQYLVKYFRKEGANWRVAEAIRALAGFREWNLLADPRPLGQFDVVFCRNVLIYFDQPTKARVLEAISRQLAPDGVLYLGGAETVLGITDRFAPVAGERGVYERSRAGAAVLAGTG